MLRKSLAFKNLKFAPFRVSICLDGINFAAFNVLFCEISSGLVSFHRNFSFFVVKFEDLLFICVKQVSVDSDGRLNESRST